MRDLVQLSPEHLARAVDVLLPLGAALVHHRLDLGVLAGMERLEGEVLELPLDGVDAEAVGERRVDLEGLARLLELLLLAQVLDRPHVVEAVGELDQDDAMVLGHRHDHLAVVLGLGLLAALEVDSRQLGDAFDEPRHLVAELVAHLLDGRVGVLDDVVKDPGGDRGVVAPELGEDQRDPERVEDEVLPAPALLVLVGLRGEAIRPLEQVPIDIGVVGRHLGHELVELLAVPFGGRGEHLTRHEPILASWVAGSGPRWRHVRSWSEERLDDAPPLARLLEMHVVTCARATVSRLASSSRAAIARASSAASPRSPRTISVAHRIELQASHHPRAGLAESLEQRGRVELTATSRPFGSPARPPMHVPAANLHRRNGPRPPCRGTGQAKTRATPASRAPRPGPETGTPPRQRAA